MLDFFQTIGVKRYIFIDCENGTISNAEKTFKYLNAKCCFSLDTQILCMIGAGAEQNKWYENFCRYVNSLKVSCNIMPIRILTVNDNALDNVLSVYIGLTLAHNQNAEYTVIAFDKGYDAVIEHFQSANIKIKREILLETDEDIKEKVEVIFNHFIELKTPKPKTLKTLRASISRFITRKDYDEKSKDKLKELAIEKLKAEEIIEISDKQKIVWK